MSDLPKFLAFSLKAPIAAGAEAATAIPAPRAERPVESAADKNPKPELAVEVAAVAVSAADTKPPIGRINARPQTPKNPQRLRIRPLLADFCVFEPFNIGMKGINNRATTASGTKNIDTEYIIFPPKMFFKIYSSILYEIFTGSKGTPSPS